MLFYGNRTQIEKDEDKIIDEGIRGGKIEMDC